MYFFDFFDTQKNEEMFHFHLKVEEKVGAWKAQPKICNFFEKK